MVCLLEKGEKPGESDHKTVDENGSLCSCGNHGCLEVMSSTVALEREGRQFLNQGVKSTIIQDFVKKSLAVPADEMHWFVNIVNIQ